MPEAVSQCLSPEAVMPEAVSHWKPIRKPAEAASQCFSPVGDSPSAMILALVLISPKAVQENVPEAEAVASLLLLLHAETTPVVSSVDRHFSQLLVVKPERTQ